MDPTGRLIELLGEARTLVALPGNDFTWSSWIDAPHALEEIDRLIAGLRAGTTLFGGAAILFVPTGPMQELSIDSGWGDAFIALADRYDAAWADESVREYVAQATFACSACAEPAGTIELRGQGARAELRRESFTSVLTQTVEGSTCVRVRMALAAGDAAGVFAVDPELAPFHCPECEAAYCGAHWQRRDVFDGDWHEGIRGRCPRGHERRLED